VIEGELAAVLQQLGATPTGDGTDPAGTSSPVAARGERDLIRGALLDDGHVPQGPLQGGLYARPRRGYHLVCGTERGGACWRLGPGPGD
jgi:hypothetical protein